MNRFRRLARAYANATDYAWRMLAAVETIAAAQRIHAASLTCNCCSKPAYGSPTCSLCATGQQPNCHRCKVASKPEQEGPRVTYTGINPDWLREQDRIEAERKKRNS